MSSPMNLPGLELPDPEPGQEVSARHIRQIVRVLRMLVAARGRNGIRVRVTGNAMTIEGPKQRAETVVEGVIDEAPTYAPTLQSSVTYTAKVVGRPEATLYNATPKYGRPVREGENFGIWPARVGDRCLIHYERDESGDHVSHLHILTEHIAVGPCPGTSLAATSGGGGGVPTVSGPDAGPDTGPDGGPGGGGAGSAGSVGGAGESPAPGRT